MKKRLLTLFAILVVAATAMARPVDKNTAMRAATAFLQSVTGQTHSSLTDITDQTPFSEFYVFTLGDDGGFILVSGDDCVLPILGYSEDRTFQTNDMPAHVMEWLQMYDQQIAFYREHYGDLVYGGSEEVSLQWQSLLDGRGAVTSSGPLATSVSPMLTTTWGQSPYYNNLCPYDDMEGARAVTGCTATAMAQIMKYWNHPSTGYGSHSYEHNIYGTLSANFGNTTYNWSNMPNALSSSSTTTQVNAVATLMYHVGVACGMNYSVSGSGAAINSNGQPYRSSAENALVTHFKYKNTVHNLYKGDFSESAWSTLLRNELDNDRPILYGGYDTSGGHAFVLDGYNTQGQFHINWGWHGNYDGHYTMGDLHPGSGGTGGNSSYTFNLRNNALVGIEPINNWSTSATTTINLSTSNPSLGYIVNVSGNVTNYSFGDTALYYVLTDNISRFYKWSDGCTDNPRLFYCTGGNITLTANVGPIAGDTLGYCPSSLLGYWGTGTDEDDIYWGIKLADSVFTTNRQLHAVQVYAGYQGSYDVQIYTGQMNPTTQLHSQTYNITSTGDWNTLQLSTPVNVAPMQNIWILIHNYGMPYPVVLAGSGGHGNGCVIGFDLNNLDYDNSMSCMVRGIFSNASVPPALSDCGGIYVGDTGSTTQNYTVPLNNWYNYSMTQTIVEASEIGGSMDINGISYNYASATNMATTNGLRIWIKPTTKTSFSSSTDIELVDESAVLVFNGNFGATQGWNDITFSNTYHYDGTGNLMIIVLDTNNGYSGNSHKFITSPCSGAKSLGWYSDGVRPDPTVNTYSGLKTTYNYRPLMEILGCEPTSDCTPTVVEIGDTNSTTASYSYPVNNYYNNTLSETIIDADEIGGAMTINSISYYYAGTSASTAKNNCTIYVQPTYREVFNSSSDLELLDFSTAVTVYMGPLNCQHGWNTFNFSTPFEFDGESNLLVIVDDNSGSYNSSSHTFRTSACEGYKTLCWYSDSYNPDPTSTTFSGSKQYYQSRVVMRVNGCESEGPSCSKPSLVDYSSTSNSATISWTPTNASFYSLTLSGPSSTIGYYITTSTQHTFYNLTPGTDYLVLIRSLCSSTDSSNVLSVAFRPECIAPVITDATYQPYNNGEGDYTASLVVSGLDNSTNYQVLWIENDSQSLSILPYSGQSFVVTPGEESFIQIRTICGVGDTSDWSEPFRLYFGYCEPAPISVDNQGITNVTFGSGNEVVNNSQRPTSAPYYGDYHSQSGAVPAGTQADISITFQTGYTYGTIIWVDWNQNYIFDNDEVVYVGESLSDSPTTLNASFTVPATQAIGNYRMRIAASDYSYDSFTGSISDAAGATPCPTSAYTIVHDYTLHVTQSSSCLPVSDVTVVSVGTTTATVTFNTTGAASYNVIANTVTGTTAATATTSTGSATLTGLTSGTTYLVMVQAVCDAATVSDWSSPISFTTTSSEADSVTIIVSVNDATMGTVLPTTGTIRLGLGDSITLIPVPNSGYQFDYWMISAYGESDILEDSIISAVVVAGVLGTTGYVTAYFSPIETEDSLTVVISVNNPAMGTVLPATGTLRYGLGDVLNITAVPNNGYQFDYWDFSIFGYADTLNDAHLSDTVIEEVLGATIYLVANFSSASIIDTTGDYIVVTTNMEACDEYFWRGTTYTQSVVATDTVHYPAAGHDTVYVLNLTIHYSTQQTMEVTAEGSYVWNGETLTASGQYTYTGTTVFGCDSVVVLNLTITEDTSVAVRTVDDIDFTVYPNPTRGMVTVNADDVQQIDAYDNRGRLVMTVKQTNRIDLGNLPSGEYLLRITLRDSKAVRRVIKH